MKTIPLFDDWMLDFHQDVRRRFAKPEPCPDKLVCEGDGPFPAGGYVNILRDPENELYKSWYPVSGQREIAGKNYNTFLCYLESEDGFNWTRPDLGFAHGYGFDESMRSCVAFDEFPTTVSKVSLDPFDTNPARRFKLVAQHIEGSILDNNITGTVYVSADGLDWKIVPGSRWYTNRMGSDCDNNLIFNPVSGRYQIICRPSCLDRRVAIVESEDLVHWSDPVVVLHPDALDEPLLQFYSMTQYWHRDYFVGLMQRQHIASSEKSGCKWLGKVDDELTYSFNGVHWNRAQREPFISLDGPGPMGSELCQQIYTNSMVIESDGGMRFYSAAHNVEHCAEAPPEPVDYRIEIAAHSLRRDGFVCLEPRGGYGSFATRVLIPQSVCLRINFRAPNGYVRVQASDSRFEPLPGFGFDDNIPLSGDETAAAPRWKEKSVADLVGERVRLEFKLFQAQVYAIDWDFHIQYGDPIIERI